MPAAIRQPPAAAAYLNKHTVQELTEALFYNFNTNSLLPSNRPPPQPWPKKKSTLPFLLLHIQQFRGYAHCPDFPPLVRRETLGERPGEEARTLFKLFPTLVPATAGVRRVPGSPAPQGGVGRTLARTSRLIGRAPPAVSKLISQAEPTAHQLSSSWHPTRPHLVRSPPPVSSRALGGEAPNFQPKLGCRR